MNFKTRTALGLHWIILIVLSGCMPSTKKQNPIVTENLLANALDQGSLLILDTNTQYSIFNLETKEKILLDLPKNLRSIDLSPNGQWVAYISREGNTLTILNIKTMKRAHLIHSPESDVQLGISLAWSPDSKSVVFSCNVRGTLGLSLCRMEVSASQDAIEILVSSETLRASDVFEGVYSPSWSQDGKKIIFLSIYESVLTNGKNGSVADIWAFDLLDNSTQMLLKEGNEEITFIYEPVFLANPNSILFSGRRGEFNSIFEYDIDTQSIQTVTSLENNFDLVDYVISPDAEWFIASIPRGMQPEQVFVPTLFSVHGEAPQPIDWLDHARVVDWAK
jgi:Tol biopolymer transport system component